MYIASFDKCTVSPHFPHFAFFSILITPCPDLEIMKTVLRLVAWELLIHSQLFHVSREAFGPTYAFKTHLTTSGVRSGILLSIGRVWHGN